MASRRSPISTEDVGGFGGDGSGAGGGHTNPDGTYSDFGMDPPPITGAYPGGGTPPPDVLHAGDIQMPGGNDQATQLAQHAGISPEAATKWLTDNPGDFTRGMTTADWGPSGGQAQGGQAPMPGGQAPQGANRMALAILLELPSRDSFPAGVGLIRTS
jgi:hypothetical protein